ncbi:MAG: hypothetical protein NT105_12285 [Verrucomicrobia bacterium]|nr:hypothetical protein [Verrucomicrobiota bacterium]
MVIHLLNFCDALGIDPVTAARSKLEQNRKKYPVKRVRGKALKYNEYQGSRKRR